MNELSMHPDDAAELHGDGYRNEWQRAAAASAMEPVDDDRVRILALLAQGYFVAVEYRARYCRTTDAIIGETQHVLAFDMNRVTVSLAADNCIIDDGDYRVCILPREAAPAPAPVDDSNECPF
jgi:hypothetical protein